MPMKREEVEKLKADIRRETQDRKSEKDIAALSRFAAGVGLTEDPNGFRLAIRVGDEETREWFTTTFADLVSQLDKDNNIDLRVIGPPQPLPEPEPEPVAGAPAAEGPAAVAAAPPPLTIGMGIRHVRPNPAVPGQLRRGGVGTLGFFARRNGTRGFVSCNHVIAIRDQGRNGDEIRSEVGDRRIGVLARFHKLRRKVLGLFRPHADCAYAAVDKKMFPKRPGHVPGFGDLVKERPALIQQMTVHKLGRTTGLTRGRISSCDYDRLDANFRSEFVARFDDVIEIESDELPSINGEIGAFANGGDSGALVFTSDGKPVGTIFYVTGGGLNRAGLTYVNPIATVERALRVSMIV